MATKLGTTVTLMGLMVISWSHGLVSSHDRLQSLHLHYHSTYGHQTWQGVLLSTKSHDPLIMWSWIITWQTKITISSLSECLVATKLGMMVTYLDGLLALKSYDPLITWSCEIKWQTKTIISPLPQCMWPPNLAGW